MEEASWCEMEQLGMGLGEFWTSISETAGPVVATESGVLEGTGTGRVAEGKVGGGEDREIVHRADVDLNDSSCLF